jgi:hypothetical protein
MASPTSQLAMNRIGIDLPQFYVEGHLPKLSMKGMDSAPASSTR